MNFELTDDQKMLVETAASFARKQSPVARARKLRADPVGWEPAVWRQLGELGWLGVMFGDHLGGFGGGLGDAGLLIEQLGTTLVPEPYLASVILGGVALERGGTAAQQRRWLVPMIAGQTSLALAFAEEGTRFAPATVTTRATADGAGQGWSLSGRKRWVLNGHAADQVIVSARTGGDIHDRDGVSLFVVDRGAPGVRVTPVATMDGRRAAMIELDGVRVGDDARLGAAAGADVLERVLDLAAAAAVAEGVGIAATVLAMTVDYLKTREQFGKKIGAFQALQHRAVDMFVHVELLRSMSILAAIQADSDDPAVRVEAVSAAKVQLAGSGRWVVRQGIQLHGGIGCTDEHDVGLYFKRMHVLAALFGDDEYHVDRFSSLAGFRAGVSTTSSVAANPRA